MEELKQHKESLDAANDADEVLDILEKLKDVKVTLELLKVTQLGLVVGNLKKKFPNDKKIVDQSRKLVADWKASCIPSATPEKTTQNNKTPTKKVEEKKKDEPKKEDPAPADKKRKLSNTEEKQVTKKPTPTPPKPALEGGSDRDRARVLISEALGTVAEVEEEGETLQNVWDPTEAATTVEAELMIIFSAPNKDYKAKLRSLSFNLKKNPVLRKDVLTGVLSVEKLCRMSVADMASEEEQKKRREIAAWHLEAATIGKMEASTDQFLCGKCKNRKCTYYQLQTRSADEPMTTFVTCTVCNNRWKFC